MALHVNDFDFMDVFLVIGSRRASLLLASLILELEHIRRCTGWHEWALSPPVNQLYHV